MSTALYRYENGLFTIEDPSIGISLAEAVSGAEEQTTSRSHGGVLTKSFYCDGVLHGPSKTYFRDGSLSSERWFYRGLPHGRSLFFSGSGTLVAKKSYCNGLLTGPYELFFPSGKPHLKGSFANGYPHGLFVLLAEDGKDLRTTCFVDGRRSGFDSGWTDDGYPLFCELWHNGERVRAILPDILSKNIE